MTAVRASCNTQSITHAPVVLTTKIWPLKAHTATLEDHDSLMVIPACRLKLLSAMGNSRGRLDLAAARGSAASRRVLSCSALLRERIPHSAAPRAAFRAMTASESDGPRANISRSALHTFSPCPTATPMYTHRPNLPPLATWQGQPQALPVDDCGADAFQFSQRTFQSWHVP